MQKNQKNLKIFLTERAQRRRRLHMMILREYRKVEGTMRPWSIYAGLAKKFGMTREGVYYVIKRQLKEQENENE